MIKDKNLPMLSSASEVTTVWCDINAIIIIIIIIIITMHSTRTIHPIANPRLYTHQRPVVFLHTHVQNYK